MRNKQLLEKVADRIEAEPERWNQAHFRSVRECGTTYCIGGWACVLSDSLWQDEEIAKELLGLTRNEADFVFYNGFSQANHDWAHKEVAEWLREIARGGDIEKTAPEWWVQEDDE